MPSCVWHAQRPESWRNFNAEVLNYRKDGSTYWVEISIYPLRDPSGWFTHWVSLQRDVTSRHQQLFSISATRPTRIRSPACPTDAPSATTCRPPLIACTATPVRRW